MSKETSMNEATYFVTRWSYFTCNNAEVERAEWVLAQIYGEMLGQHITSKFRQYGKDWNRLILGLDTNTRQKLIDAVIDGKYN